MMEFRFMGKTGMLVSELCLGAMTFGRETPEDESYEMMDRFEAAGGNFIDTADVYSTGISEQIVGRWLVKHPRDQWVIATKARFPMGSGPNEVGLSRKHLVSALDASLKRLQTDYIDLYQVHAWDNRAPLEETLSTLNDMVRVGKVRYIGVSNYTGWQLQKAIDLSKHMGWEPYTCLQAQYNLLVRTMEWELIQVCLNEGVGLIPWSPLRGGWLSGRYQRGMEGPPPDSRVEMAGRFGWGESWQNYNNEFTWSVLDALYEVAEQSGKHPAQVAIRWLMQMPAVTAPIIGVRSMAHLEVNLGACGWELNQEQMQRLNQASDPGEPYPYEMVNRAAR
jgi:aryl-alcohol dehydrogenase-like predicted oxidoreductase